jgi:hypothetical protein
MSISVYKPLNNHPNPKWRHSGDTFREIIDMWEEKGYIDVIETAESPGLIWMYNENDVLLYDRPTFEWYNKSLKYNIGLFGNPAPPPDNNNTNVSWIFWGRHPRQLENHVLATNYLDYNDRKTKSIFIGNIENNVQNRFRSSYDSLHWKTAIEKLEITKGRKHKYSHSEYLKMMNESKYGLSIRGYGGKCNREIELLALGTVPLLTSEVDTTYYDPLIQGLHYVNVDSPSDAQKKMDTINENRWKYMSLAGRRWYKRNCSTKGSFETTKRIIELSTTDKAKSSTKFKCVSTMATNNSYPDLQLMLYSLHQFHMEEQLTVFIVCDQYVKNNIVSWCKDNASSLSIVLVQTLDQYSGKNRAQIERSGKWLEFMLRKCDGIDKAFDEGFNNVFFVDSDMVFLHKINFDDFDLQKGLGRSNHRIKKANMDRFGIYNGGMLWINHHGFTDWWKHGSYTKSRYFEQAILDDADEFCTTFEIPIQYNYGWWRLYECEQQEIPIRESKFRVVNGIIEYDGKPLTTVHTHFGEKSFTYTIRFNQFINKLLIACKDERLFNIYNFIQKTFYNSKNLRPVRSSLATTENGTQGVQKQFKESAAKNNKQIKQIKHTMSSNETLQQTEQPEQLGNIHLIVQYYNDSNSERQDEIDYCFKANLSNPHVLKLHNLVEPNTVVPEWLSSDPKYVEHKVEEWVTYKQAFDYANKTLPVDSVACFSNADIFLDHSSKWQDAKALLDMTIVLCLSRYEFDGISSAKKDEALQRIGYANAQDAWVFKTPMLVRDCDFKTSKLGSDNAIADRIKNSGYIPINSPNQFKLYHYDVCRGKTGGNFLNIHKPNPEKPEDKGYYLLPDIDSIKSVDSLMTALKLSPIHKYRVICDIMSRHIELSNPDEK